MLWVPAPPLGAAYLYPWARYLISQCASLIRAYLVPVGCGEYFASADKACAWLVANRPRWSEMIVTISCRGNNTGNSTLYPQEKALYKCKILWVKFHSRVGLYAASWLDLLFKGVYTGAWCCSYINPRYFNSCLISLSSLLQLPDLGRAVVGWVFWSRGPSLSSAATVLTSRNHLTVVVVMIVVTPFQTRICWYWWTNMPSLSTSSPVDPLTGANWEGLAQQEHLEECKHRTRSGWPQESWSYLGWSRLLIFNWIGGWDVWVVHQLPNCFVFLASHKV